MALDEEAHTTERRNLTAQQTTTDAQQSSGTSDGGFLKPPQAPNVQAECVTTCGADGMMLVDAAQESWPRDLSLYVLRCMYDVPLPEHAECLAVDALLRMLSLDFEVEEPANVEYMSPSGRAPFIKCGRQLVSELDPILHHLSRKGVSLSSDLTEEDTHRQEQLWSLVQCTLSAAELRVCWLHPKTRDTLTEPQVVGRYPWPLSTIIGRRKRNEALSWLTAREPSGTAASDLELSLDTVYKQVDDVCSTLSTELGGAPYFFGQEATELEAMIYGHLFLLLTVPVPVGEHTSLSQVIQEYPNLVSLVARMDDEVFGRDLGIFLTS
ncbi:metaxin-2-like [Schistocerca nitens]|uniref:metaxin-2-like n=1 Tax=Schistocerca nitens TaxID=7011 RepID=UPI00211831CE|nr:metaxin-2-like [Schistocerca nitens]